MVFKSIQPQQRCCDKARARLGRYILIIIIKLLNNKGSFTHANLALKTLPLLRHDYLTHQVVHYQWTVTSRIHSPQNFWTTLMTFALRRCHSNLEWGNNPIACKVHLFGVAIVFVVIQCCHISSLQGGIDVIIVCGFIVVTFNQTRGLQISSTIKVGPHLQKRLISLYLKFITS